MLGLWVRYERGNERDTQEERDIHQSLGELHSEKGEKAIWV